MTKLQIDVPIQQLAQLDVVDVRLDGTCALNREFVLDCRRAYAARPSQIDSIICTQITDRVWASELMGEVDLDALLVATLEIGGAETEAGGLR